MKYQPSSPAAAKRMNADEKMLAQAEQHAEFYRGQLTADPSDEQAAGNLAETLIILGESDEAETVAPSSEVRSLVRHSAFAAEVDDEAICNCPNDTIPIVEGGVMLRTEELSRFKEERRVFSKKHNRVVPMWVCVKCNWANAMPDPPDMITAKRYQGMKDA